MSITFFTSTSENFCPLRIRSQRLFSRLVMTFTVTRFLRWVEKRMDGPQNYAIHGSQTVPDVELLKKGGADDE